MSGGPLNILPSKCSFASKWCTTFRSTFALKNQAGVPRSQFWEVGRVEGGHAPPSYKYIRYSQVMALFPKRICVYIYIYIIYFPRSSSWWNRTHELWFIVSSMFHHCSPFPQFKNSFLVFKHFRALPMAYRTVWPFVQVWCFRGIWVREAPVTTCRGNNFIREKISTDGVLEFWSRFD